MKKYVKYLRPFLSVLGIMAGIGFGGAFISSLYGPVLGYSIPIANATLGAIIAGGLSLLGVEIILPKIGVK